MTSSGQARKVGSHAQPEAWLTLLLAVAMAPAAVSSPSHDFGPHRASDETCPACHTPRHAGAAVPAWSHAFADGTYPLYVADQAGLAPNAPGAASKVCFSCHDGTVASSVDSSQWAGPGSAVIPAMGTGGLASHGPDAHPVGIDYASTHSRSGNLSQTMLSNGRVECTSCHDVHNIYTVGGRSMTKVDMSTACRNCHDM
jgi:predicted CXXCH cytochrome family protein